MLTKKYLKLHVLQKLAHVVEVPVSAASELEDSILP